MYEANFSYFNATLKFSLHRRGPADIENMIQRYRESYTKLS